MKLTIADGTLIGKHMYFSNVSSNGLFRISVETHEIEFLGFFPGERVEAGFLHKRCFNYGDKIIFLPAYSKFIAVFDISSGEFFNIPLKKTIEGESILDAVQVGAVAYIFPRNNKCVPLKLDMETMEITDVPGFDTWVDQYVSQDNPEKLFRAAYKDGCIYFAPCEADFITEWNIIKNTFQTFEIGMEKIINILPIGNTCFFTLREQYGIGKLNIDDGSVVFEECKENNHNDVNLYGTIFPIENGVGAAPAFGEYIHCFDNSGCFYEYQMEEDIKDVYKFYRSVSVGSDIWLLPLVMSEIYILKRENIYKIKLTVDNQIQRIFKNALLKERVNDDQMIFENNEFSLCNYVEFIAGE